MIKTAGIRRTGGPVPTKKYEYYYNVAKGWSNS